MKIYTYKVSGYAPFPVDMLRHDQAFPKHEDESHLITSEYDWTQLDPFMGPPNEGEIMYLELAGLRSPTLRLWSSFGWTVDENSITWMKGG